MRLVKLLVAVILSGLISLAFWSLPNRPVSLDPPPGGKLRSLSFAPYHDGQSPLTGIYPSPEEIAHDVAALSAQTTSLRTYTALEGMEALPAIAKKYGMTVTMGGWLSGDLAKNAREMTALIDLANRYPDVITRVIVGNEVLLRRDLTAEQLIGYIDQVRAAVKQPVSYADVWEWWLKYPELAPHVDYVTIHLLPYWEDVPAGIEGAMRRVDDAYHAIALKYPGKPILVGETGWPTAGRARGPAQPGVVEMAKFTNGLLHLAEREGFDYNIIEAFDQNWKQALEGVVGGHWGLYTADRQPKFSVSGPVIADVRWPMLAVIATALSVVLFTASGSASLGFITALGATIFATVLGTSLTLAGDRVWSWAYYASDEAFGVVMVALEAALALALMVAARRAVAGPRLAAEALRRLPGTFDAMGIVERVGGGSAFVLVIAGIVWAGLVIFDGRYRSFPNPHFLVAAFGMPLLGLIRAGRRPVGEPAVAAFAFGGLFRLSIPRGGRMPWIEIAVGALLILGAVGTVIAEGFVPLESILFGQQPFWTALGEVDWTDPNGSALGWAGMQILLAIPFLAAGRTRARHRIAAV